MKRRTFNKNLALGLTASGLLAHCSIDAKENTESTYSKPALIKPKKLKRGDKVGLITPGSFIPDKALAKAVKNVKGLGLQPVLSKNIRALRGFNAGTDQERLDDLHRMFEDPSIAGIWCARGGYGCTRLLPMIDYDLIKNNPKVFLGYSDITALHNAFLQRCGLVSFHGPVASSTMTPYAIQQVKAVLMNPQPNYTIRLSTQNKNNPKELYKRMTVNPGKARGQLIGGNLSLLAAMAGTPYQIDATDKLVFMEDVEEKPYSVDRMLTQLIQSSNLAKAKGFALGVFADCVPEPEDRSLDLFETIEDRLKGTGKPAAYGFSWGHISNQATLPVGVLAEMDTQNYTLSLLEAGVV